MKRYIMCLLIVPVFVVHQGLLTAEGADVPVSISGPDAPVDGDCYTVTGGQGPYTWSISAGSIDANGCVAVSGECGGGIVTVTDDCGAAASMEVRMPNGVWAPVATENFCSGVPTLTCSNTEGIHQYTNFVAYGEYSMWGVPDPKPTCEEIGWFDTLGACLNYNGAGSGGDPGCSLCGTIYAGGFGDPWLRCCKIIGRNRSEWQCP